MKEIPRLVYQKCCGCRGNLRNKYLNRGVRRVSDHNIEKLRNYFKDITINIGNYICNKCQNRVKKNRTDITVLNKTHDSFDSNAGNISLEEQLNSRSSIRSSNIIKNKKLKKTIELPTANASQKNASSAIV